MKENMGKEMNQNTFLTNNFGDSHLNISRVKGKGIPSGAILPVWEMLFKSSTEGLMLVIFKEPFNRNNAEKDKFLNDIFSTGKIVKVNEKFIEQFQVKENEIIGITLSKFFDCQSEKIKKIFYTLFEKGEAEEELQQKRKDSTLLITKNTFIALTGNNGRIWGFLNRQTDIIETKAMIRESEDDPLRSLLDILQENFQNDQQFIEKALDESIHLTGSKAGFVLLCEKSILIFKPNCYAEEFNKDLNAFEKVKDFTSSLKEFFGLQKPIIINDTARLNFPNRPKFFSYIHKIMVIPVILDNKLVALTGIANKTGNYKQTDINLITLIMGITCLNLERKKFQDKLSGARKRMEDSEMLKTAFLANLSHEIRTPMNGIMGFSTLLSNNNLSFEKRIQYTEIINQSCLRLLDVIDKILDIAKIETNQIKITRNEINLRSLLEEIYSLFYPSAQKNGLELILENKLPDNMIMVNTDENKLKQIINHLMSNAIKFTQKGYVKLTCEFHSGKIEFEVKDTGIGIAPENQQIIFERFRQLDNSSRREFGGCGLGLTISKEYVKLLGGELKIQSQLGKGTSFLFELPVKCNRIIPKHFIFLNNSN